MLTVRETAFKTYMAKYSELLQTAASPEAAKTATAPVLARLKTIYDETRAENGEEDPFVLFMQGRLLFLQDEAHAAVKALKRAEELTAGETPDIQRVLAILYSRIGSTGAAEQALNVVLAANPNDETAQILQANIKNQLGQPEQAHIAADRVLTRSPGNKEALRAKMQAYLLQKNYQAAEATRNLLTEGSASTQDALVRAMLRRQDALASNPPNQDKLVEAAGMLEQVLANEPLNYNALVNLVTILSRELPGSKNSSLRSRRPSRRGRPPTT
jgi:predicted Zn-dependent protease